MSADILKTLTWPRVKHFICLKYIADLRSSLSTVKFQSTFRFFSLFIEFVSFLQIQLCVVQSSHYYFKLNYINILGYKQQISLHRIALGQT